MQPTLKSLSLLSLLSICIASPATAQSSYAGKTIRIVVASAAGTAYDSFARTMVRHLPNLIQGEPNMIVQNMPGAGGLIAANYLYNRAEKDGTTIGMLNRNSILDPLIGNSRALYKTEEFHWLGTPASYGDDPYVFVIHGKLPHKTAQDVIKADKPIQIGNSGTAMIFLMKETMGLNINIVGGYEKNILDLAFQRGEVDGTAIPHANLLARFPGMFEKGEAVPIVQFGSNKRSAVLPNVPTGRELAVSQDARALLMLAEAPLSMAYPFALPPGVPAERAAAMRKSFDDLWQSEAYRHDVVKQKLVHAPKSGEDMEREIAELLKAPPSVIARYSEISAKIGD